MPEFDLVLNLLTTLKNFVQIFYLSIGWREKPKHIGLFYLTKAITKFFNQLKIYQNHN